MGANGTPANADWTAEGNQTGGAFGISVGTAGDVNGDGYSDVVIGDMYAGSSGRAWVYYGSSTGLATTAGWQVDGPTVGTSFGYAVGTTGDINGDGYADVLVGERSPRRAAPDHGPPPRPAAPASCRPAAALSASESAA
jgi:hypothetical protein